MMKMLRALVLSTATCLVLLAGVAAPGHATSVFRNTVEANAYSNDPFNTTSPPPTLIHPFNASSSAPWTMLHPNPVHGFASSQGVSALFGDGSGLAVHAQADLVPGASFTRSEAVAIIEFEIVDPSTHLQAPVDVSFVGMYLTGVYGEVEANLWQGLAGAKPGGANVFRAGSADPDVGQWTVQRTLMTRNVYSLELVAEARTFAGYNSSSVAFIDPVISFDLGQGIDGEIRFDSAATLQNPNFIAPVPEPTPLVLGGCVALGLGSAHTGRRAPRSPTSASL